MYKLMTLDEAAVELRVSKTTIYRLLYAKKIRAVKVGRQWRISSEALEEFIQKGEQNTHDSEQ